MKLIDPDNQIVCFKYLKALYTVVLDFKKSIYGHIFT